MENQDTEYNENDSVDGFPNDGKKEIHFREEDDEATEII